MDAITIVLFFIYCYGLGYTLTSFVKRGEDAIEQFIMDIGIGLGSIPVLLVILNIVHIPIDWRVLLGISAICFAMTLFKKRKEFHFSAPKITVIMLLLFIIFGFTLFMYLKGAFAYPYLEDDDPWSHAIAIKYVSSEKTLYDRTDPETLEIKYLDPYPPGYTGLLGILHQTSSSLNWTMKFFNALIISLSLLFFFFFAKEFFGSKKSALIATLSLAMIPAYMSHFIWAIALTMPVFLVALYSIEQIREDKKWYWITGLLIASMLVTQPSLALIGVVMIGMYWFVKSLTERKIDTPIFYAMVIGVVLSLLWWIPMLIIHGSPLHLQSPHAWNGILDDPGKIDRVTQTQSKLFNWGGTADRIYTLSDFIVAHDQNMINNPIGIGIVLSGMLIISFLIAFSFLKKDVAEKRFKTLLLLFWLLFAFLGVESAALPIQFFAFRFWMVFALAVSLISVIGIEWISDRLHQLKIPIILTLLIMFTGIFFTSFIQKYTANTAEWPPGIGWTDNNQLLVDYNGYSNFLLSLPKNTHIFAFSGKDDFVLGLDGYSCWWCPDIAQQRWSLLKTNATEIHRWLKDQGYEYAIMDGLTYKYIARIDKNETALINPRLNEMIDSGLFVPIKQIDGGVFLKVV